MDQIINPDSTIIALLKEADKYGLTYEVVDTALSIKGENPSVSNREALEQACREWDI